jgi:large subunit ribosomal protein L4
MIQVAVTNLAGKKIKDITLSEAIFGLPSNDVLLHQVYVALAANERQTIAHTKDRSERAGSGRKPWKQKGTGRARVGEVRNPVWRKGGVVFGPRKEEVYGKDTNKKMRQKAVMIALAEKIRGQKLLVVDSLVFAEMKTKLWRDARVALGVDYKSTVLAFGEEEFGNAAVTRNIPKTSNTLAVNLNVSELLNNEYIVVSVAGLDALTKRFSAWEK